MFNSRAIHAATGHSKLLGVYIEGKISGGRKNWKTREYICPLPKLDNIIEYKVVKDAQIIELKERRGSKYYLYSHKASELLHETNRFRCITSEKGKDIFGVVVVSAAE